MKKKVQWRLVADFVDIDGAKALLDRAESVVRRRFQPQKIGRHLLHAGRGQQHGRIVVRHQRRRGHFLCCFDSKNETNAARTSAPVM